MKFFFTLLALFTVAVTYAQPVPGNKNCVDAIDLQTGSSKTFNNTNSSSQTVDMKFSGKIYHTVWYSITPSVTKIFQAASCGADFDTKLAVYDIACNAIVDGSEVGFNDDYQPCIVGSMLEFRAEAGTTYLIAVGGSESGDRGFGRIVVYDAGSPVANDSCSNAIAVEGGEVHAFNNTLASTDEPYANLYTMHRDVWYSIIASDDSGLEISTCLTGFDTQLAIYEGTCENDVSHNSEMAYNNYSNYCDNSNAFLRVNVTKDQHYLIRVAGSTKHETGEATVSFNYIRTIEPPTNDNAAGSMEIPVVANSTMGQSAAIDIVGATNTLNGPYCNTGIWLEDVWYRFNTGSYTSLWPLITDGSEVLSGNMGEHFTFYTSSNGDIDTQLSGQCNNDIIYGFDTNTEYWFKLSFNDEEVSAGMQLRMVGADYIGVNEFQVAADIVVSPNPVADMVTLQAPNQALISVEFTDVTGQVVKTHQLLGQANIDVSELPTGIYLIKYQIGSTTKMKKLMKK
jgi:hypothetical protein